MRHVAEILLTDLRHTVAELGTDGGLISPSIYDTAQVLRLAPPPEGPWPGLAWLTSQQQSDGGWGDPAVPRARDVPTLAAIIALQMYGTRTNERMAVQAGLSFLRKQAVHWLNLLDDLPVGIELLLPRLLNDAAQLNLKISSEPYSKLIALGNKRRQMIESRKWPAATPPLHSWEAWGGKATASVVDGAGSVGHSPAATAAWLRAAGTQSNDHLADARAAANQYLERAAAATGIDIPGVVPTVWPIARFEQSFALYTLQIAGLLELAELQTILQQQIVSLARSFRSDGIGMSDCFLPDGDDTAAAMAVLHATGRKVEERTLEAFASDDHYCAYRGELQPSLSVTAHALHVLALLGKDHAASRKFLMSRQKSDGRWLGDKWNGSWVYTTSHTMIALHEAGDVASVEAGLDALLLYQHEDGGWGMHASTPEETAYAVLGLRALRSRLSSAGRGALARGKHWLLTHYQPFQRNSTNCWLGKEMYRPERLARIIELAASLPQNSEG